MTDGFNKPAGAIGDTLKNASTLYQDALQPTIQEVGKLAARIPRAINAALSSLDKWILHKEYAIEETKALLEQKLENINPEKIVKPEAYVAVPALQAISYSMNSAELRNLYANLLAKAMNSDTKDMVHPSFIEIIKQMAPIDAWICKTIMERDYNPLIDIIKRNANGDFSIISTNVSDMPITPVEKVSMSINNLVRQGLISIPAGNFYSDDACYQKILSSKYYHDLEEEISRNSNGFTLSYKKHLILKTSLGQAFYQMCICDN